MKRQQWKQSKNKTNVLPSLETSPLLAQPQVPGLISCGQSSCARVGTNPGNIMQRDSLGHPSEAGTSQMVHSKLKTKNPSPLWGVLLSPPRLSAGRAKPLPSSWHHVTSCRVLPQKVQTWLFVLFFFLLPSIFLGQVPQGLSPTLVSPTQTLLWFKTTYL